MSGYAQENIRLPSKWIALNLNKRECSSYVPTTKDPTICQCGRRKVEHGDFVKFNLGAEKWSPAVHTRIFPTDAYGTILFEGEQHPNKAHYVRLSYDTNPEQVMNLLRYVWGLPMPKLVVSVHGGIFNFDLSARLGKAFQNGIMKAAKTTSAWVISSGLNSGVSKHLGNALGSRLPGVCKRKNIVSIGIAPWGMCEHKSELIGRNKERVYSPLEIHNSNMIHLNPRYSNFLLVDNGSVGRFGSETFLRRKLEKSLAIHPINQQVQYGNCTIPVVVIIMEGGCHTMKLITEYLYDTPPIPVILFAGTGKMTDLVAATLLQFQSQVELVAAREEIFRKIVRIFHVDAQEIAELFEDLIKIYERKILVTVYNGNSANEEELDTVILSSIFRSQHWSPLEQLELTMVWNRVDLAQSEVFVYGREWNRAHLEKAMMEALVNNRLEFVELLMEHGINMKTFLTVDRLEKLYSRSENSKLMNSLLLELSEPRGKRRRRQDVHDQHLSLQGIGSILLQMGIFRPDYVHIKSKVIQDLDGALQVDDETIRDYKFPHPFDDLFLWALLTKRQELAKLLWLHGQGALAKALVAVVLNNFFVNEMARINISAPKDFENNVTEWKKLSLSLLDSAQTQDFKLTRKLLTMELKSWPPHNCLTLAVLADHKTLLGHPCCQIIFADLWMGILNVKSNTLSKIILAAAFPPFAFFLQYKSTEEVKVYINQDNFDKNNQTNRNVNTRDEEVMVPESDSLRTLQPAQSIGAISSTLRSRNKVGRRTNLSEIVSKLELKRTSLKTLGRGDPLLQGSTTGGNAFLENPPTVEANSKKEPLPIEKKGSGNAYRRTETKDKAEKLSKILTAEQNLNAYQKFMASQKTPIANFIRHFIGYIIFIICLWYVILYNQDTHSMGRVEIYVTLCMATRALECIRGFITAEGLTFTKKIENVRANKWRLLDIMLCIFFLIGTAIRFKPGYFKYTMAIYRTSSIYWNLRLYKYLAAHRFVGPKLLMMSKMFYHMSYFSLIIIVLIFAFAVAKESIRLHHRNPSWTDVKPSFIEPYIMMFGEVDTLEEAVGVQCFDEIGSVSDECPFGALLIPLYWMVYMMISNILIVNVLIAVFNGIYIEIDSNSIEIWMSQQFVEVVEFLSKPPLPPPFIIICHLISLCQLIYSSCKHCIWSEERLEQTEDDDQIHVVTGNNDHSLKTFLDASEQEIVFNFEEESVDLLRNILADTNNKPPQGSAAVYLAGTSEKSTSVLELKTHLQELYTEMDNQQSKIDKLIKYWELEVANQKDREDGTIADDDDDDTSTSDSSSTGNV